MLIRLLDPVADRALVDGLFAAAADYVWLEREMPPDVGLTDEFFNDAPPGSDPAASHRVGLFDGEALIGAAEMSFGFPDPDAAYLGLMLLAPACRGSGAGPCLLRHLEAVARRRGARMLYLAVLDANQRGRAFWQREGFALALADRIVTLGQKTQIAHRLSKALV